MPVDQQQITLVFKKLDRQLAKLSRQPQPGNVHQFRTYSRRLQALLEEISPSQRRSEKKLLKVLGRLRRKAGRVRDLDVQIAALRSLRIPQEPKRKTQLLQTLLERRIGREKKLNRALDKGTIRWLRKRLKKTADSCELPDGTQPLELARKILLEVSQSQSSLNEEALHQYRIAGKRTRYVAELAGKDPEARQFIEKLKAMQDALGDWHDWLLLTQSAEKVFAEAQDSALLTALRNVTRAKYRHALQVVSEMREGFSARRTAIQARALSPASTAPHRPAASDRDLTQAATA